MNEHRVVCAGEHDPSQSALHGDCRLCGESWPCASERELQQARLAAIKERVDLQMQLATAQRVQEELRWALSRYGCHELDCAFELCNPESYRQHDCTCGYSAALSTDALDTKRDRFDLIVYLERQRKFSERTFGPGARAEAVVDHIRLELVEVLARPRDLFEWIDVVMLALDGSWRAGYSSAQIAQALAAKLAKNEKREWPDWRTQPADRAIEHIRPAPPDNTGGCL